MGQASNASGGAWQSKVIDSAHTFGWRVGAFRPALTKHGWRTPVQADGAGWPDLALFHAGRGVAAFRELKAGRGRVTPEQAAWGELMRSCGLDWAVWRDTDWPEVLAFLSFGLAKTF